MWWWWWWDREEGEGGGGRREERGVRVCGEREEREGGGCVAVWLCALVCVYVGGVGVVVEGEEGGGEGRGEVCERYPTAHDDEGIAVEAYETY